MILLPETPLFICFFDNKTFKISLITALFTVMSLLFIMVLASLQETAVIKGFNGHNRFIVRLYGL